MSWIHEKNQAIAHSFRLPPPVRNDAMRQFGDQMFQHRFAPLLAAPVDGLDRHAVFRREYQRIARWDHTRQMERPLPAQPVVAAPSSEGLLTEPTAAAQRRRREPLFMPRSCHSRLTLTVATRSFKSIPMSRLGNGSCGDAFLDVGPACGN